MAQSNMKLLDQTQKPYVKTEIGESGTLISKPIDTQNVISFLPIYFVLTKPVPNSNIEAGIEGLRNSIEIANINITERDMWLDTLFQMHAIMKLSKERITDSYDPDATPQAYDNSIKPRSKRGLIESIAPQGSWVGDVISSWTGLASFSGLLKVAEETENNYDRFQELWIHQKKLFSVMNSTSQYIHRNRNDIDNIHKGLTTLTTQMQEIANIIDEKSAMQKFRNDFRDHMATLRTFVTNFEQACHGFLTQLSFLQQARLNSMIMTENVITALGNSLEEGSLPTRDFIYSYLQPIHVESTQEHIVYGVKMPILSDTPYERYLYTHIPIWYNGSYVRVLNHEDSLTLNTEESGWYLDSHSSCIGDRYNKHCLEPYLDRSDGCLYSIVTRKDTTSCDWHIRKGPKHDALVKRVSPDKVVISPKREIETYITCSDRTPMTETISVPTLFSMKESCAIEINRLLVRTYPEHWDKDHEVRIPSWLNYNMPSINISFEPSEELSKFIVERFKYDDSVIVSNSDSIRKFLGQPMVKNERLWQRPNLKGQLGNPVSVAGLSMSGIVLIILISYILYKCLMKNKCNFDRLKGSANRRDENKDNQEGQEMAFLADCDYERRLREMEATTQRLIQLTNEIEERERTPVWGKDWPTLPYPSSPTSRSSLSTGHQSNLNPTISSTSTPKHSNNGAQYGSLRSGEFSVISASTIPETPSNSDATSNITRSPVVSPWEASENSSSNTELNKTYKVEVTHADGMNREGELPTTIITEAVVHTASQSSSA